MGKGKAQFSLYSLIQAVSFQQQPDFLLIRLVKENLRAIENCRLLRNSKKGVLLTYVIGSYLLTLIKYCMPQSRS